MKIVYDTSKENTKRYEVQWKRPSDFLWTSWSWHSSYAVAKLCALTSTPVHGPVRGFIRIIDHEGEEE